MIEGGRRRHIELYSQRLPWRNSGGSVCAIHEPTVGFCRSCRDFEAGGEMRYPERQRKHFWREDGKVADAMVMSRLVVDFG